MQDVFQLFVKDNISDILTRLGKVETEFTQINQSANQFGNSLGNIGNRAFTFNQIAESVGRISDFFGGAINKAGSYSDQIADIQRTTNQTRLASEELANSIGKIDTRTDFTSLLSIAEAGGSIGVANDQLRGFVQTIDMANVVMGKEFSGGVEGMTKSLGILKGLFSETKGLRYDEAMSRIGASMYELTKVSTTTGGAMADFSARIGQLGSLAPTVTQTLGLGATLQELGLTAEIASGGLTNLILVAGENADRFARQLGMTTQAFRDMLSNSPNDVIIKLAESFKGLAGADIIQRLQVLKVGTQESIKVFQALSENTDLLKTRQAQASEAYAQNTALVEGFTIKNETLGASLDKTRKFFEGVATGAGRMLAPIAPLVTSLGSLAQMGVPVVGMLGRVGSGLTALLNPYTLATAGGLALLASFVDIENGTDLLNVSLRSVSETVGQMSFQNVLDGFGQMFTALSNTASAVTGLKSELTDLGKVDLNDLNAVSDAVNKIGLDIQARNLGVKPDIASTAFMTPEEQRKLLQLSQGDLKGFYSGMQQDQRRKFEQDFGIVSGRFTRGYSDAQLASAQEEFARQSYSGFIQKAIDRATNLNIERGGSVVNALSLLEGGTQLKLGTLLSGDDAQVKIGLSFLSQLEAESKKSKLSTAFAPPPSIDELKSIKNVGQEISGGGSRPTNIYINIGKFQDQMIINTETTGEATGEIEDKFNDTFLRILRGVNQYN